MLPHVDCLLAAAHVFTEADRLVATTGCVRRAWRWTGQGFATCSLVDERSGRVWVRDAIACDWQMPDAGEPSPAQLQSLTATIEDDEGFTSPHICVRAEMLYPASGLCVRFTVWTYPSACGFRTQLAARTTDGEPGVSAGQQGSPLDARVDRLPITGTACARRLFGYYNETQQRNDTHQNILKEEVIAHRLIGREWCDWASAACMEDPDGGVALVKESHKCVNQRGHATGGFIFDEHQGLSNLGWGLRRHELQPDTFTAGWATWCLLWVGGDFEREQAFKTFDRTRYPIDPKRDIYVQANTWGSTDNGRDARRAAGQPSVLRELERCAELGIDVLQIDDGWQVPPGHDTWQPGDHGWRPHPDSHPQGWTPVRARAEELGVTLGLWAAAVPISLDDLKASHAEGGFLQYKLDFAVLKSRAEIDALMHKVRAFIQWTGHRVRINWDVTENPPRYGYFFGREYGCIYLENRKPTRPISVIYRPHTVLRDLWQIARYLNLHRFQGSIQNVDLVDRELSDAHLHSHAYAIAIALMSIPLFFLETKYYSAAAAAEVRRMLSLYKPHRDAIYRGIVHPIGDKPDNASWTGFQSHLAEEHRGYLTVFRERCNANAQARIKLGWVGQRNLRVTDLVTGQTRSQETGPGGTLKLDIPHAPGFLFLAYDVVS